jgi:hypothetical protein
MRYLQIKNLKNLFVVSLNDVPRGSLEWEDNLKINTRSREV